MDIVVSISGYTGLPVSLLAMLDHASGVLAIAKEIRFREEREEGFAFVTNTRAPAYDCLFKEDQLAGAITVYKESEGSGVVALSESVAKFRPRVDSDGVNEHGQKWRLHPDMSNGEVAVLALVHFMEQQRRIQGALDAMDDLMDLVSI